MSKSTHLFTYIVEFRGGTYCSQVNTKNIYESLNTWVELLRKGEIEIKHLGEQTIKEIVNESQNEDENPLLLNGLQNIWCFAFSTRHGFLLGNIVLTDTSK